LIRLTLCSIEGAGVGTAAVATPGCNNDWNVWWVGSRTQWNVTKDFYLGVDVLYSSLQSASTFNGALPAAQAVDAANTVADQNAWSFEFRVHKDFYP
jgi:hypothetical protein